LETIENFSETLEGGAIDLSVATANLENQRFQRNQRYQHTIF